MRQIFALIGSLALLAQPGAAQNSGKVQPPPQAPGAAQGIHAEQDPELVHGVVKAVGKAGSKSSITIRVFKHADKHLDVTYLTTPDTRIERVRDGRAVSAEITSVKVGEHVGVLKKRKVSEEEAIMNGLAYLRQQIPNGAGGRPGAKALLGLTLLESGAPPKDPDVQKVADMLRKDAPTMNNPYDIAPTIFFLDRLHKIPTVGDKKIIHTLGLRLVAGQRQPKDLWRYQVPILTTAEEEQLKTAVKTKTHQGPIRDDQDMSCSQFAALGLWVAGRHGVPGVEEALKKAGATARKIQEKNGTWHYGATGHGGQFEDTSTCCGVILLSLGHGAHYSRAPILKDKAVISGLKHLEGVIKMNQDPKKLKISAHGVIYFLWALERTALILDLQTIGQSRQDWYDWGTRIILDRQHPAGNWSAGNGAVPDTCFALLFILQPHLFKDLTARLDLSTDAAPLSSSKQPTHPTELALVKIYLPDSIHGVLAAKANNSLTLKSHGQDVLVPVNAATAYAVVDGKGHKPASVAALGVGQHVIAYPSGVTPHIAEKVVFLPPSKAVTVRGHLASLDNSTITVKISHPAKGDKPAHETLETFHLSPTIDIEMKKGNKKEPANRAILQVAKEVVVHGHTGPPPHAERIEIVAPPVKNFSVTGHIVNAGQGAFQVQAADAVHTFHLKADTQFTAAKIKGMVIPAGPNGLQQGRMVVVQARLEFPNPHPVAVKIDIRK